MAKVNPSEIFNYLTSEKGLSESNALGMIANIKHESSFDPKAKNSIGATGLFQHLNDRKDKLVKYTNGDLSDWKKQIDFALSEPEGATYAKTQFNSPREASMSFTMKFERPENKKENAIKRAMDLEGDSFDAILSKFDQDSLKSSMKGTGRGEFVGFVNADGSTQNANTSQPYAKDRGEFIGFVSAAKETPAKLPPAETKPLKDLAVGVQQGVNQGIKMVTDAFGTDNPASQFLQNNIEGYDAQYSAGKKQQDIANEAERNALGEDASFLDQATLAAKQAITSPSMIGQGIGQVLPMIGTGMLGLGAKGVGALAAVQGAGSAKSNIYENIKNADELALLENPEYAQMRNTLDEKQAKEALATKLQSYGENWLMISANAALGAGMSRIGAERYLGTLGGDAGLIALKEAAKNATLKGVATTTAKEVATETLQEPVDQLVGNVGAAKGGAAIDATQGLAESAGSAFAQSLLPSAGMSYATGINAKTQLDARQQAVADRVRTLPDTNLNTLRATAAKAMPADLPIIEEEIARRSTLGTLTTAAEVTQQVAPQGEAPAGTLSQAATLAPPPVVETAGRDAINIADILGDDENVSEQDAISTGMATNTIEQPSDNVQGSMGAVSVRSPLLDDGILAGNGQDNAEGVILSNVDAGADGAVDDGKTNSLSRDSSWVIRNKETGEVIQETFQKSVADKVNTDKYEAVPVQQHLGEMNDPNSKVRKFAEKPNQFVDTNKMVEQGGNSEQLKQGDWQDFHPDTGTLNIPRDQMPQIKAEHRGAMVNFLNARGIQHKQETVPADTLKPTQKEFSLEKVQKARDFVGGNRSILVSSDNHVVDGHHQWIDRLEHNDNVDIIRLDAPIKSLLDTVKEFPSATTESTKAAKAPAARKPKPRAGTLLAHLRNLGGIKLSDKLDVTGEDRSFAAGGYNQVFKGNAKQGLRSLIENGDLDDFLPYNMRLQGGSGADAFDSDAAYDYLRDRIANGDRILSYEVEEEARANRYHQEDGADAQTDIDELVELFSEDEINEQLRIAGNTERETTAEARQYDAPSEEGDIGSSTGSETGTQDNDSGRAPSGSQTPQSQEREGVRPLVEALTKRRAAAAQMGSSKLKVFNAALDHAKQFLAGEEIKPIKFSLPAAQLNGDPQISETLQKLAEMAKPAARQTRKDNTAKVEAYKAQINEAKDRKALEAIAKFIQDDSNIGDTQAAKLDDLVMDAIDALDNSTATEPEAANTNADSNEIDYNGTRLYKVKIRSRVEGQAPTEMWATETPENKARIAKGERALGGDGLFDTLEEAKAEADALKARTAASEKANQEAQASDNAKKAEQEAAAAKKSDLDGFGDGLDPMQLGRVRESLNKPTSVKGKVAPLRDTVRDLIKQGAKPKVTQENVYKGMTRAQYNRADNREQQADDKRVREGGKKNVYNLEMPDGSMYELGKTAHDFAEHLINKNGAIAAPAGTNNTDLLGDNTQADQAIADAKAAKDEKRNTGTDNQGDFVLTGSNSEADKAAAMGAQDLFAAPKAKAAEPVSEEKAKAQKDLNDALSDLADIFGANFKANITPEEEQKLLPVVTRVMDAAFRLGYENFKAVAKFVLDTIRAKIGDGVADQITLDHLQGSYIAMAGKYGDKASSKKDVINVDSIDEIKEYKDGTNERSSTDMESTSQDANAQDSVGAQSIPNDSGSNGGVRESGVPNTESQTRAGSGDGILGSETATTGKRGNSEIHTRISTVEAGAFRDSISERSGNRGVTGAPIEPPATERIRETSQSGLFEL